MWKKNNTRIWIAIFAVLAISFASYFGFLQWTEKVAANPDYICIKSVNNEPCKITRCDSWSQNWTRTCYWTKTTKVAYYHRRTSCSSGYTNWGQVGNSGWASWRISADYPYQTSSCTIVETDRIDPTWDIDVNIQD